MFLLLLLLAGLGGLHAGSKPRKIFLHTTVPEKISSTDAKQGPDNKVIYAITIQGKPYFVHLKKQSFLSPVFLVYSYDKKDIKHSKHLLTQVDCNYNGYVAGFVNSLVTLSTCSGLRGIIQFKNISYGIEPMEAVPGFVHMIYEEKSDNINFPVWVKGNAPAWLPDPLYQVRKGPHSTKFTNLFPLDLEMRIFVDKNLFDYMGSDLKTVTQKVTHIIGLVNTMLTQLKLTVVLSSVEIWSNKNKISPVGSLENVLLRFLEWKHDNFKFEQHHISFLFALVKHASSIGITFPGKICDENHDVGVALYPEGLSLESYTVIIVQLLGLHLGLTYDDPNKCYCTGDVCTMTPKAVYHGGIKDFSTCSVDNFKYFASNNYLKCLQNKHFDKQIQIEAQRKICGNGILEPGEQCDCGTVKNCTHKSCCDPTSCILKGKSECGSGECCSQACKVKPANVLCRKAVDKNCDFDEYCNGKDANCVLDTFARNGESCDEGSSYCYGGMCRSFDRQCQTLVGGDSTGGSFPCYDEINSRMDKFGNCGRALCAYAGRKPPRDTITTLEIPEERDETFVEDGSMCGPNMYCHRMVCKEVRFLLKDDLCNVSRDCNDHGLCNNFDHCHCEKGFAPPDCEPKKGEFGSVDDGHKIKTGARYMEGKRPQKQQLQISLYLSLPLLFIIIAVLLNQNKIRKRCYREEAESQRSVSENTSSSSIKTSPTESNTT